MSTPRPIKLETLQIYGMDLPPAGAIFLAPLDRRNSFSAAVVKEAYKAVAKHWPPSKRASSYGGMRKVSMYRDRIATGEMANGEPDKVFNLNAFEGARFKWDEESQTFVHHS